MANTHSITLVPASSQYLYAPDSASLSITGNMTAELYTKPTSLPSASNFAMLLSKDNSTTQRTFFIDLYNNAGSQEIKLYVFANSSTLASITWTYTLSTTVWTHVAIVYTAANPTSTKAELFINGVSQGSGIYSGSDITALADSTAQFEIGSYAGGASGFFDGKIDDVRMWNVSRTQSQISANKDTELIGNESGLQAYWKLNNALTDSTSNGNTLTNPNTASFTTDVPFTGATDITVLPSAQAGTFSQGSPSVSGEAIVASTAQSGTFATQSPSIVTDVVTTPNMTFAQFSAQPVQVNTPDATAMPSAQTATFLQPSPLYIISDVNDTETPTTIGAAFSIPAPTIIAVRDSLVLLSPIMGSFSLPSRTVVADKWQNMFTTASGSWNNKY